MNKEKELKEVFNKCKSMLLDLGIQYGIVEEIKFNARAKSRWGQCKRLPNGNFSININPILFSNEANEYAAMNTVMHELLHTCSFALGHKGEWQKLADKVNAAYPFLTIQRCTSAEDKGLQNYNKRCLRRERDKYEICCPECGERWFYKRNSLVVRAVREHRASCPICNCENLILSNIYYL